MAYTEGQVPEADFREIAQDTTEEDPRNESTSVDSFKSPSDTLKNADRTEKPWVLVRKASVRATYTNGRDNDPRNVIFVVGNAQQSSKFVLSKSLLKFSSQLFCKILEETPVQNGVNQITDVASVHFECIVQYLFGHFTWTFTTMEAACCQIEAANRYELKALYDDLFEELTQLVINGRAVFDNEVACRAWVLFKSLDENRVLAEAARDYILKNAAEILRGDTFLDLSQENLLDILMDNNLAVESELDVYKALLKWGAHNLKRQNRKCIPENFRRILTPLIPAVRFPNMTQSEFVNYVLPLEVLSAAQEDLLKGWWNGSKAIEPRRYLKPTEDRTIEIPVDDQFKLEKAEADVFIARNEIENIKYNFDLEIHQLRQEITNQNSIMSITVNRAKDELLQENAKLEADLLLPEVQALKTEVAQLSNKMLAPEKETRLKEIFEAQDIEILKLFSNSAFADKALQHSLNFQKLVLERLPQAQAQKKEAEVMLNHAQDIINPSEEYVCKVVLRNKTSVKLTNPFHFFHSTACRESCPKPLEIPQNTTETFGFVCQKDLVAGLFSYQIRDKSFLVKYSAQNGYNDLVIGFAPPNIRLDRDLFNEMGVADWSADIDRRKAIVWTKDMSKALKATVEMGDLRAVAAMTTGPNVVLSIVLANV